MIGLFFEPKTYFLFWKARKKDEKKFIMILDIEKALSIKEIVSLNTIIHKETNNAEIEINEKSL